MESSPSTANSGLVFVNFNQDFGCFVAVTSEGFRIFNADPLRQNKTDWMLFYCIQCLSSYTIPDVGFLYRCVGKT